MTQDAPPADPRETRLDELLARYAATSATSAEGGTLAREIDALRSELREAATRRRIENPKKSKRPWRGRIREKSERTHWAGRRDGFAAASGERSRDDDPADQAPFEGM